MTSGLKVYTSALTMVRPEWSFWRHTQPYITFLAHGGTFVACLQLHQREVGIIGLRSCLHASLCVGPP
jgi:hypothetical protein